MKPRHKSTRNSRRPGVSFSEEIDSMVRDSMVRIVRALYQAIRNAEDRGDVRVDAVVAEALFMLDSHDLIPHVVKEMMEPALAAMMGAMYEHSNAIRLGKEMASAFELGQGRARMEPRAKAIRAATERHHKTSRIRTQR